MFVLFGCHGVKHCSRGRKFLIQIGRVGGVDALILFLREYGERQHLLRAEIVKPAAGWPKDGEESGHCGTCASDHWSLFRIILI